MLSERLQLKLFLEPSAHFELEPLIPVFHRFIRDQAAAILEFLRRATLDPRRDTARAG